MKRNIRKILRMKAVLNRTGLSKTTLWRRVKSDQFPPPVRLGGPDSRAVGWIAEEVDDWIDKLRPAA